MTDPAASAGDVLFLHPVALDAHSAQWLRVPGLRATTLTGPARSRAGTTPLSLETMADAVAAELHGPTHLVGCSMGGMVAMHLALRHPGSVASLVLAFTAARVPGSVMVDRADETMRRGAAGMVDETLARWFTPETLARTPASEPVEYVRTSLYDADPASVADCWRAIAGHDVLDRMEHVTVPSTCVAGTRDVSTPPSAVAELAEALPHARVVELGTAHMGFLEDPEAFSGTVLDHLTWVASTGGTA